jgi:hypothetical protein
MTGDRAGKVTPNSQISRNGGGVIQNNQFIFAAPTSNKTQTQVANRASYEQRRAARLG